MLKPMRLEDLKDMDLDDEILEDYRINPHLVITQNLLQLK